MRQLAGRRIRLKRNFQKYTELKEALEQTILPNVADHTKNYLYSTLWTAISKAENKMIGDLCIVGEPNAAGEIEIGYGTYVEFQGGIYDRNCW